ncbi:MAG: hypothetical protein RI567_00915 [Marinobacter sp.]|nr:hypothetical protein [Marinobacter sp.]
MKQIFVCLLLVYVVSGCATIDREVSLGVSGTIKPPADGLDVYIEQPENLRVFHQNQKDIKKPSYNGYVRDAAQADLDNVIGRFVNPITGDMQGVIRLENKQSVQEKVEKLISLGLARQGYVVSDSDRAPYKVRVVIDEFWGWNEDGEVTFELNSVIRCSIELVGQGEVVNFEVSGRGVSRAMVASASNWEESYQLAVEDFLNELEMALQDHGASG